MCFFVWLWLVFFVSCFGFFCSLCFFFVFGWLGFFVVSVLGLVGFLWVVLGFVFWRFIWVLVCPVFVFFWGFFVGDFGGYVFSFLGGGGVLFVFVFLVFCVLVGWVRFVLW